MIYDLQKANMWKRISAYVFDVILYCIIAVGVAFLLSAVLGFNGFYYGYVEKREAIQTKYETEYGINFDITQEQFDALPEEEKELYGMISEELRKDTELSYLFNMTVHLCLIIATFSLLIPHLLLDFTVPLFLKNGQTLGKKIFGVALMRIDGVKISPLALLVRTLFGKFTIETMFPAFVLILVVFGQMGIVGLLTVAALLILQIVLLCATQRNTPIHDLLAGTVAVDLQSQLIFDSPEELLEYKKKIHAEEAQRAQYP
ncbi:MAG: RDD family protein [Clostridia bacterium]|nr:RDD family protein [Clostridia bacterium]